MDAATAAQNALQCVLEGKKGESITIICDDTRAQVGKAFEQGALNLGLDTHLMILPTDAKAMRSEIPQTLTPYLTSKHANIYINLLREHRKKPHFASNLSTPKPPTAKPALDTAPASP
jgi:hypothetical protein